MALAQSGLISREERGSATRVEEEEASASLSESVSVLLLVVSRLSLVVS